jgi:hypothetical protein
MDVAKLGVKVTELLSKAILLPMFVYGDCMAVCLILYTSATGVAEIAKSTHLKGCPHNLVCIGLCGYYTYIIVSKPTKSTTQGKTYHYTIAYVSAVNSLFIY